MTRRIRSSKTALENAIEAAKACGLTVHKVLITGGQYEVFTMPVEALPEPTNDKAPKQW